VLVDWTPEDREQLASTLQRLTQAMDVYVRKA
jgi:hypothetical protein